MVDDCDEQPLLSVLKKCTVEIRPEPSQEEWKKMGGKDPEHQWKDEGDKFWSTLWYNEQHARFEYPAPLPVNPDSRPNYCGVCVRKREAKMRWEPVLGEETEDGTFSSLTWNKAPLKYVAIYSIVSFS